MCPDQQAPGGEEARPKAVSAERGGQPKRRFRVHVGNYAWSEMVIAAIGLLSFPILTRLLTVADYGTMNLVASALGITVALGKVGMQHSVLRAWAEVDAGTASHSREAFEATVLWGMAATGGLVTLLWAVAVGVLPETLWGEPGVALVMLLAAPLIVLRVLDSAFTNLLRAQEQSGALATYSSARRLAQFVLVVGVLWGVSRDVKGFFVATLVAETLAALILLGWMYRGRPFPRPSRLSGTLLFSLAAFGLPMLGSELATVVLVMSDRFLIQNLLGAESLGVYAATYNLCDHVRGALLGALVAAAYPRCMTVWEREGKDGLARFLASFMHYYAIVAIFMVALMAAIGTDVMVVLASSKYSAGGPLAGWIMGGLALQAVGMVAAVGIFIAKRTIVSMVLLLVGGMISITSNLVLIPLAGLPAAGWVVLGSSLALCALQMMVARRYAPVVVPWRTLLSFGAAGLLAVVGVYQIGDVAGWQRLGGRSLLLVLAYGSALLLLDRPARSWLLSRISRS